MTFFIKLLTVKVRIALVSVAFVAGLVVIGGAYLVGSGKVAAAFADARAFSALERGAGQIGAKVMELRSKSMKIRVGRQSNDLREFADRAKELSGMIDALAAAPRADAFAKPISALKAGMAAIAKHFGAVDQMHQTLGDTGSNGLVDRVADAADMLSIRVNAVAQQDDTVDAERMLSAVNAMERAEAQFDATFDDRLTGVWKDSYDQFNRTLDHVDLPKETKNAVSAAFKAYADAFKAASDAELNFVGAAESLSGGTFLIGPALNDLDARLAAEGEAAGARLADAQTQMKTIIFVTILLALACGLASAILVGRTTARPLGRLRDAMLVLAAGDLEAEIPALGRADEIGQMAKAVGTFKEAALDRVRLEREALDQRETNEAERHGNEAERAARAREQEQVVAIIARGHEQLSRGNLTHRIAEDFPPAYQKLKDDFNAAIGNCSGP